VSADVIQFKQKPIKGTQPAAQPGPDTPRFFCRACDSDHFMAYPNGSMHCACCGALMRNLTVFDGSAS
jgi:hypothetical protein